MKDTTIIRICALTAILGLVLSLNRWITILSATGFLVHTVLHYWFGGEVVGNLSLRQLLEEQTTSLTADFTGRAVGQLDEIAGIRKMADDLLRMKAVSVTYADRGDHNEAGSTALQKLLSRADRECNSNLQAVYTRIRLCNNKGFVSDRDAEMLEEYLDRNAEILNRADAMVSELGENRRGRQAAEEITDFTECYRSI